MHAVSGWTLCPLQGKGGIAPGDQYRSLSATPTVRRRHSAVSVATILRAGLPRVQQNNEHRIKILNFNVRGTRCSLLDVIRIVSGSTSPNMHQYH